MTKHSTSAVGPGWHKTDAAMRAPGLPPVWAGAKSLNSVESLPKAYVSPFCTVFFPLTIAAVGCPIYLSSCAKGSSNRCWPSCHRSLRGFVPGRVQYPCAGCTDPARSLSAGEWDGGERSVRIRLRVGVQRTRVSGGGSAGSAYAGLLPHEEPQLCQGHWEGLLPGWRVHIAALLVSPAYNHHGEDHPEQYWWVTQRGIQRGRRKGRYFCVQLHQIKLFSARCQACKRACVAPGSWTD